MAQWYVEDGSIVPKNQQVIYSRGCIFFYVPRRAHTLNIANIAQPYAFTRLPATVAGFERLNDRPVDFDTVIHIKDSDYKLRSVVCLEVNKEISNQHGSVRGPQIVTGQSAIITKWSENDLPRHYWYNPKNANIGYADPNSNNRYSKNDPVTVIDDVPGDNPLGQESFYQKVSTRGTIFVYEQREDAGLQNLFVF